LKYFISLFQKEMSLKRYQNVVRKDVVWFRAQE